ncbi:glycosyltransferase family 2 protein [Hymenobacter sp. NBH84]|uniref:glycosyltransferase n=1 Tax=Hymenobacter sp. NBH84 TaxID=2596915 RepID=UPI0016290B11|nr:glycosyltransferase [Hymenobacter sp. NBH84]QNE38418.1 glycosyltransferase family 2 protein [Hymenobacter sp. NBH84]
MELLPVGISFLVCTYNSASRISETLGCLAQQKGINDIAWEVILVANACTDDTVQIAKACWERLSTPAPLRTFAEPRPGKNFAVEVAFSQARYRYACIVDDDNWLAPDYLQTGYETLVANPQIGILGGQNTGAFEVAPPEWFAAFQPFYAVGSQLDPEQGTPLPDGRVARAVLWGAGMYVRTELWHQLRQQAFQSLFVGRQGTKNLTAGEDDELCYAARLLGYDVWYCSKLTLQHYMTAGRLTAAYRDRLFYGTVWSQARLKVYRDVLWGPPAKDFGSLANLTKDFLYMSRNVARKLLSRVYVCSLVKGRKLTVMGYHHQLLTLYDFICNFRRIRGYYKSVAAFKAKATKAYLSRSSEVLS